MVSNIIVHLFSKCVHFYKYNAEPEDSKEVEENREKIMEDMNEGN